ncbi:IPT/TIG domain protein [compost metagenome]
MPKPGKRTLPAVLVLLGVSALVACDATKLGVSTEPPAGAEAAATRGIRGKVLDLAGQPAGGVAVRGTLISNNAGGLISNNGGGLISNNGGNLVSNGSGLYRIQSGFETQTAADGTFSFNTSEDQVLTLEAVQRDNIKAIKLGAASSTEPFTLQLAPTGHIKGRVVPADSAVTDLLNIDVFIPGTSYVAKTDDSGNFTLSNVPAGRFTLVADHQNLGRAVIQGVSVVSNQTVQPPALELSTRTPVLTSVTPADGAPGSLVTLKGEHFGISSGKRPDVFLNGVSAQLVSATDTEITAMIPLGSVSGNVRVSLSGLESANRPFRVLRRLDLFPEYQRSSITDLFATPPTSDVLAVGASRSYHVRAFDTEGRLVPSPTVTWSLIGNQASGFADGVLTPSTADPVAIAAVSGSLSSAPLSVEILPTIVGVDILPKPIAPLNPVNTAIPPAQRSTIPDWVQLKAKAILEGNLTRETRFWYQSLDGDLTISETGLVRITADADGGTRRVKIIPVADPAKSLTLDIPVLHQGDLSFIIE